MFSKISSLSVAVLATVVLVSGPAVRADEGHGDNHTPNYCSTENKNVCIHLGHFDKFVSDSAMEFMAHVLTPQNAEVKDFKLHLWMDMGNGHGHGSSPVTVTSKGINKFWISDANFVMSGKWLVKTEFTFDGTLYKFEIPVEVE